MGTIKHKPANCKTCYKCLRNCPVKAIEMVNEQANIIDTECILCANCVKVCPQKAMFTQSELDTVRHLLKSGKKVVAYFAPNSHLANFEQCKTALIKLGFSDVVQSSKGYLVVKNEYEKILNSGNQSLCISSSCHTVNRLITTKYPSLVTALAGVISPVQASARLIKERDPNAEVVLIGACLSQIDEAKSDPIEVAAALTLQDTCDLLSQEYIGIDTVAEKESKPLFCNSQASILSAMKPIDGFNFIEVNGINNVICALEQIKDAKITNTFLELNACSGGCAQSGCKKTIDFEALKELSESNFSYNIDTTKAFKSEPSSIGYVPEHKINEILTKMNKRTKADMLDCGSCGYDSCREKAVAVFLERADISICLQNLKEKAENFSDIIIQTTPNAIISIDKNLNIRQINGAALKLFNLYSPKDLIGFPAHRILDISPIIAAMESKVPLKESKVFLEDYNKTVEQQLIYDSENNAVIMILRDVTAKERQLSQIKHLKDSSVEITDKVIDKQMRIVQEIAFLLGETAAETKVALTNLKNTVLLEEDD